MNGLVRELIRNGWIDERYVREHAVARSCGKTVEPYTIERVVEICDVSRDDITEVARIIGTADRLLSTVLEGLYQSN